MIDDANLQRKDHIITVEDPIEFGIARTVAGQSSEVGMATKSFSALARRLARDPAQHSRGEMRDLIPIDLALTAAAPGHLVSVRSTRQLREDDRPYHRVFPAGQRHQIRSSPRGSLKGMVAQTSSVASTIPAPRRAGILGRRHPEHRNLNPRGDDHQIPCMMQSAKRRATSHLDYASTEPAAPGNLPRRSLLQAMTKRSCRVLPEDPADNWEDEGSKQ